MSTTFPNYEFPENDDQKRRFFSENNPKDWDFGHFANAFPEHSNERNHLDYMNGLNWIKQHFIDFRLRSKIQELIKEWKKPSRQKLEESKKAVANMININIENNVVCDNNQQLIFKGDNNHGNVIQEGSSSSSSNKRDRPKNQDPESTKINKKSRLATEQEDLPQVWEEPSDVVGSEENWCRYGKHGRNLLMDMPELYGVCWCGQGVKKRENIPIDLYQGIQEQVVTTFGSQIYQYFEEAIDVVLDAKSIEDTDLAVESFPVVKIADELRYKGLFVKEILSPLAKEVYTSVTDIEESESSWNVAVLYPMMKACARYISLAKGRAITFVPGEAPLQAMTNIGVATTKAPYNADGILRVSNLDKAEICLLETSSAYNKAGRAKISFDHHKAMFALLAMIKNTAQNFQYATYDELKKMKFIFIHAHGDAIRIWSLSSPEPGVYIMNKELKMPSPKDFYKKVDHMNTFMEGSWKLVTLLTDAIDALDEIDEAHKRNLKKVRKNQKLTSLSVLVEPTIKKMSERQHATIVTEDGPMSSPIRPPDDEFNEESDVEDPSAQ
ncbi:hypothetical protein INT45_005326 [Circinella minor]|uniref:Uncharacterized protein n=1 Tax=Circinella minor TaxID=1195481 RepID=A0A8H7SAP7_9FUNG|nr:hypothetical protein INT45_005326 [Circinella minor]